MMGRTERAAERAVEMLRTLAPPADIVWALPRLDWIGHVRDALERAAKRGELKWVAQGRAVEAHGNRLELAPCGKLLIGRKIHLVDDEGEASDYAFDHGFGDRFDRWFREAQLHTT